VGSSSSHLSPKHAMLQVSGLPHLRAIAVSRHSPGCSARPDLMLVSRYGEGVDLTGGRTCRTGASNGMDRFVSGLA